MNNDHPAQQYREAMAGLYATPPPEPAPARTPRPVAVPPPPAGFDWAALLRFLRPVLVPIGIVAFFLLLYLISH